MSDHVTCVASLPANLLPKVALLVQTIVTKHGLPAPLEAVRRDDRVVTSVPPRTLSGDRRRRLQAHRRRSDEADRRRHRAADRPCSGLRTMVQGFGRVRRCETRAVVLLQAVPHASTRGSRRRCSTLSTNRAARSSTSSAIRTAMGSWKRRGLVIGDVQSGKTATYIGIVNKAADAGYKLVVLLTGATESLRSKPSTGSTRGSWARTRPLCNTTRSSGSASTRLRRSSFAAKV